MLVTLSKNDVSVAITSKGASIEKMTVDKRNVLWNGDAKWWGRVSPYLFPIVGRLRDNEYIHDGKTYTLSQHGFLRDSSFDCVSKTENSAEFVLKSNAKTKEVYPFDFEVNIKYILFETSLEISVSITNTSTTMMHYSFGCHPAFNISDEDAWIELQGDKPYGQIFCEGPYVGERGHYDSNTVRLNQMTYEDSTLIFEGVERVVLHDKHNSVAMDVSQYPQLGIWRPVLEDGSSAPFVCLEPWLGYADSINHSKKLEYKEGISHLNPGEHKVLVTTIEW